MIKGIDVSRWQGSIDFNKVKEAGYSFVIIKAGGSDMGFYKDPYFETNYEKAKAAGLHIGAYYFTGRLFYGERSGRLDALRFIEQIKGKIFELPLFVDIETTLPGKKTEATEAAEAFCLEMEKAGYFAGIYASDIYGFRERLDHERLRRFAHWCADYSDPVEVCRDFQVRQISSRGTVPGINGYVDLDITDVNYLDIMKKNGLNGFTKAKKERKSK